MKIHIWFAKWFLTIQIRTIPYYWKYSLQYLLCPRILRTTLVFIIISVLLYASFHFSGTLEILVAKQPTIPCKHVWPSPLFQNYWLSHNWQGQYNVNIMIAILLQIYMTSILLTFAVPIHAFSTFLLGKRDITSRHPFSFMMRRNFHMSCIVTTVLPYRYVLIYVTFPSSIGSFVFLL